MGEEVEAVGGRVAEGLSQVGEAVAQDRVSEGAGRNEDWERPTVEQN